MDYYVYTDGACSNNGKPNAKAGYGVYFGKDDYRNVSKKVEGKQSNNTGELMALIEAYRIIENDVKEGKKITVFTDSKYCLLCLGSYGDKCSNTEWNKDIPNKELVRTLYDSYKNSGVIVKHVLAHTGKQDEHSKGNAEADRLANEGIGVFTKREEVIFLNVPYSLKEEAKKLGAKWNPKKKKWYIEPNNVNKNILIEKYL